MGLFRRDDLEEIIGNEFVIADLAADGAEEAPADDYKKVSVDEDTLEEDGLDYAELDPELDSAHSAAPKGKRRKRPRWGVRGTVGPAPRFTWREVTCTDGTQIPWALRPNAVEVAKTTNNLRVEVARKYKVPVKRVFVVVNSWYRSPNWNARIGGVSNSRHLHGDAMDVNFYVKVKRWNRKKRRRVWVTLRVPSDTVVALADRRARFRKGGVGRYSNFIHLDTRGYRARWRG